MVELRGITWNHARGFDPLVATAIEYAARHPGISIKWERRSLQAFGDQGADELATRYDFLVIDHPHVGQAAAMRNLVALDTLGRDDELATLALQHVAHSQQSYLYGGHQWALAIDTAAHVSAYRPDLLPTPPTTWAQVIELARQQQVIWPLKPVDSLMSFFTVCANSGEPAIRPDNTMADDDHCLSALTLLVELGAHLPAQSFSISPPEALEVLSSTDQSMYCPALFGYSNYSRAGFRQHRILFGNIPHGPSGEPRGSILGGTGLAISAHCRYRAIAVDYAFWIAGAECQRTTYFTSGGQPANAAAWDDHAVNTACGSFFLNTRKTLDQSWIRPRYKGYIEFQTEGSHIVHDCLTRTVSPEATLDRLKSSLLRSLANSHT